MRFDRRFLCEVLVIVTSLACADRLVADHHETNAALKYWQAFSTMPKVGEKLEEKLKSALKEDGFGEAIDQPLANLVNQSEYALRMLERGTQIRDCDWGIDMRADGAETILPHLVKARSLSRVLMVRARYRFEQKKPGEGIDDIVASLVFARHASHDGTLIGLLVGHSIEMHAGRVLAAYLPMLDQRLLERVKERLESLPPMTSTASAAESEKLFLDWGVEQIGTKGEGRLLKFCETLTTSKQQAEELLIAGGNREQFVRHLDALRPLYDDGIGLLTLSPDEFEAGETKLAERLQENPVSRFVFPDFGALYETKAVRECHWSLFMAAIDIQANGRTALESHEDPYGEGPFELIPIAEREDAGVGYRIRSRLERKNGEVVQLTVGRPAR